MTIVLVHGNPETAAIWEPLTAALGRADVVALSPPGFGAPVPEGFAARSDDYLAWLVDQLEDLRGDEPIDLVGHDWGGGHVQRLAGTRPDLIRSWVTDIAGCTDPDYVWHDLARSGRRQAPARRPSRRWPPPRRTTSPPPTSRPG